MNIPNLLSLLRIIGFPLIIVALFFGLNGLAVIIFVFGAFTDIVDGYLARKFSQVSDLGKYLDPLADKMAIICILIALVALGKADPIPVMIIAARELFVQGIRIGMAHKKQKVLAASAAAKLKICTQAAAIVMLILNLPYADYVLWAAAAASIVSGWGYLWQSKILKLLKSS